MKEYINQIFYEGLGYSLYLPIENKINKIRNNNIKMILKNIYRLLYLVFVIAVFILIIFYKL